MNHAKQVDHCWNGGPERQRENIICSERRTATTTEAEAADRETDTLRVPDLVDGMDGTKIRLFERLPDILAVDADGTVRIFFFPTE